MKGTLLGVAVSESESEAVADQHLGRGGLEHIWDHLAPTPAAGRGNPWPPLLSLRGRRTGGKVWVERLARAPSGLREAFSALGS